MTLGADGFINFIVANILETAMMIFKRVALDPIKFRLIRVIRFRLRSRRRRRRASPALRVGTPA